MENIQIHFIEATLEFLDDASHRSDHMKSDVLVLVANKDFGGRQLAGPTR